MYLHLSHVYIGVQSVRNRHPRSRRHRLPRGCDGASEGHDCRFAGDTCSGAPPGGERAGGDGVPVTVPYSATAVVDSTLDGDPGTGSWTDAGNLNLADGTKSVSRVVIL